MEKTKRLLSSSMQQVQSTVEQKASKISEIFASLVETPKSPWSCNIRNGDSVESSPVKSPPRSQNAFYNRVESFGPGLWSVRGLSPLEVASWGWKLLEKDVLQCVSCREVICADLPDIQDRVAYEKFFGLLKERLEISHKESCPWMYNPCPREFVEPLRIDTVEELRNMTNLSQTLSALNSALPYINNNRIAAMLGTDDEVINGLFSNDSASEDVKMTSVLLVLSGWSKGQGPFIKCTVCRRQVGLWSLFTIADEQKKIEASNTSVATVYSRKRKASDISNDNSEESADDNRRVTRQSPRKLKQNQDNKDSGDAPTPKRMKTRSQEDKNDHNEMDVEKNECLLITSPSTQVEKVEKQYFSPLEEHRYWCPWITKIGDETADSNGNGHVDDDESKGFCVVTEQVRAMLQVSKQLRSNAREKYGENVTGLRIIRNLLDEVSSD